MRSFFCRSGKAEHREEWRVKWNPSTVVLTLFVGFLGFAGTLLYGFSIFAYVRFAAGAEVIPCKIISREVQIKSGMTVESAVWTSYYAKLGYSYEVKGATPSRHIASGVESISSASSEEYPIGSEVRCLFNPSAPSKAVLDPKPVTSMLLMCVLLVCSVLLMISSGRVFHHAYKARPRKW